MDTNYKPPPGVLTFEEELEKYGGFENIICLVDIIKKHRLREIELVPIGLYSESYYCNIDKQD